MKMSKRTLSISILLLVIVAVIVGIVGYKFHQGEAQDECGESVPCVMDAIPDYSDVNIAYSDDSRIYIGHLGSVENELQEVHSWVFPFTMTQRIFGEDVEITELRQVKLRQGDTPLSEGNYIVTLGGQDPKYPQSIARADRISPEEVEQLKTPADARRVFGDNHAVAYAN